MSVKKRPVMGLVVGLVLALAGTAGAQQKADLSVLLLIPADGAFVVVVPGVERLAEAMVETAHAVAPKEMVGPISSDMLLSQLPMGEGFDKTGSFAAVLLDPRKADPEYVKKVKDEKSIRLSGPGDILEELPIIYIVPTTDAKKVFKKEIVVTESDGLLEYKADQDKDADLYGKAVGQHVVLALKKTTLQAWSNKISIMTKLSAGHEKALTTNQIWFYANRKLLGELRKEKLLPIEMLDQMGGSHVPAIAMVASPSGGPLIYLHETRDEIFNEATSLSGGLRIADKALYFDSRWTYPADTLVGKKLAAFKKPAGPLIRNMPSLPGMMVYGADKSAFSTPLEIKKQQYAKLLGHETFKQGLTELERKTFTDAVNVLQEQVVTVEHFMGLNKSKDGAFTFITVARVRNAKKVMAQAKNLALFFKGVAARGAPIQIVWTAQAQKIGMVDVAEINLQTPPDPRTQNMIKKILGDAKARFLIAAPDDNTVIVTLGGNVEQMAELIKTARGGASTQLPAEFQKVAKLLPANRAAEVFVSPREAIATYYELMFAAMPGQGMMGPMPDYKSKTPAAGAAVIEPDALRIVGVVPLETIKGYFDMMQALQKQQDEMRDKRMREMEKARRKQQAEQEDDDIDS